MTLSFDGAGWQYKTYFSACCARSNAEQKQQQFDAKALLSYLLFVLSGLGDHEQRSHDQSAYNKEMTGQQRQFPVHDCPLTDLSDSERGLQSQTCKKVCLIIVSPDAVQHLLSCHLCCGRDTHETPRQQHL